jgi:hypothetical protein
MKYIVGKKTSFIFNRRAYSDGEEIDEECFGEPESIKRLLASGKLIDPANPIAPGTPATEPPAAPTGNGTPGKKGKTPKNSPVPGTPAAGTPPGTPATEPPATGADPGTPATEPPATENELFNGEGNNE